MARDGERTIKATEVASNGERKGKLTLRTAWTIKTTLSLIVALKTRPDLLRTLFVPRDTLTEDDVPTQRCLLVDVTIALAPAVLHLTGINWIAKLRKNRKIKHAHERGEEGKWVPTEVWYGHTMRMTVVGRKILSIEREVKAGEAAGIPKEWELWPEGEDKAVKRTSALRSRFPFHFANKSLIAQSHRLRQQAARSLRNAKALAPESSEKLIGNEIPEVICMSGTSARPKIAQVGGIEWGAAFQDTCQRREDLPMNDVEGLPIPHILSRLDTPSSPSASHYPPSSSCNAGTDGPQLQQVGRNVHVLDMTTRLEQQSAPAAREGWLGGASEYRGEDELGMTEGQDTEDGVCDPAREHVGRPHTSPLFEGIRPTSMEKGRRKGSEGPKPSEIDWESEYRTIERLISSPDTFNGYLSPAIACTPPSPSDSAYYTPKSSPEPVFDEVFKYSLSCGLAAVKPPSIHRDLDIAHDIAETCTAKVFDQDAQHGIAQFPGVPWREEQHWRSCVSIQLPVASTYAPATPKKTVRFALSDMSPIRLVSAPPRYSPIDPYRKAEQLQDKKRKTSDCPEWFEPPSKPMIIRSLASPPEKDLAFKRPAYIRGSPPHPDTITETSGHLGQQPKAKKRKEEERSGATSPEPVIGERRTVAQSTIARVRTIPHAKLEPRELLLVAQADHMPPHHLPLWAQEDMATATSAQTSEIIYSARVWMMLHGLTELWRDEGYATRDYRHICIINSRSAHSAAMMNRLKRLIERVDGCVIHTAEHDITINRSLPKYRIVFDDETLVLDPTPDARVMTMLEYLSLLRDKTVW